jgi:hypothetical protein
MNDATPPPADAMAEATPEEILAALFANMVIQQTNMAMMLLGKVAHPETGKFIHDVEAAKMFIDQLEMLEAKTKGNLSKEEDGLLKQALTALRMAFVEAIDVRDSESATEEFEPPPVPKAPPAPEAAATQPAAPAPPPTPTPAPAQEESRKKFSKKY